MKKNIYQSRKFRTIPALAGFIATLLFSGCTIQSTIQIINPEPTSSRPPTPSPAQSLPSPAPTVINYTVETVWKNRFDLVNKKIIINDIISMDQVCTQNFAPGPTSCVTGAMLGLRGLGNHPFFLYQDRKPIQCTGKVDTCQGFTNGAKVSVSGTLIQKQLSGELLDSFYFEYSQ